MVQNSEQFRQSDVKVWGIAALVCAGIAVLAANVSGLIPSSALNTLHSPRSDAASLSQLRQQVAELLTETAQLRRQNEILTTRFSLQEQSGNEVVRRVGALEVSMPNLAEMRPVTGSVDRSVTTASITSNAGQQFAADGGTVVVHQSPLQQPLPAPIAVPSASSGAKVGYAVAVGSNFASGQAAAQWRNLEVRLGSLVIDMSPLVTEGTGANQQRLVIGPIAQMSEARDFCQRLEQMEIACSPTSFAGAPIN
ncbi:hypothetical protein [Devosia sp. Root685]|uniref:hypothetical protein n=1 Tax=Devosia sp. Root685 TaxID=1736587 RepID=UPI0012E38668|nr:hypothetical protein [Devosia sp. Root685]